MSDKKADIDQAIAEISLAIDNLVNGQQPNDPITEFEYSRYRIIARNAIDVILNRDDQNYIHNLNSLIAQLKLPDIDSETASRGLLIVHQRAQNVVNALYRLKDEARQIGYRDPTVNYAELKLKIHKEVADDIKSSIVQVINSVEMVRQELKKNKQIGITVQVGPVAYDVGVLADIVKTKSADAIDFMDASTEKTTTSLKGMLQGINDNARLLYEGINQSAKRFTQKTTGTAKELASAANKMYIKGLLYIKNAVDKSLERAAQGEPIGDTLTIDEIDATFWTDRMIELNAKSELTALLIKIIDRMPELSSSKGNNLAHGRVVNCRLTSGIQQRVSFVVKEGDSADISYVENKPQILSSVISAERYDYLSKFEPKTLVASAIKALELEPRGDSKRQIKLFPFSRKR